VIASLIRRAGAVNPDCIIGVQLIANHGMNLGKRNRAPTIR